MPETGTTSTPRRPADDLAPARAEAAGGGVTGAGVVGSEPARVALAVIGPPAIAEVVVAVSGAGSTTALALRLLGWGVAVVATLATVVRPLLRSIVDARLQRDDLDAALAAERLDRDFRARFERALSQTDAEPAALRTALRAVEELVPDSAASLLLAVPDEPQVGWTVRLLDGELLPARPIPDTPGCAALAANATATTRTSTALDACAHLQDPTMEVSATCVPLRLGDRVLGVLSVVGAPGEELAPDTLATLEWLVDRTGVRISEQRRRRGPSVAGREDPVTGLPGATALDRHLRETIRSLTPFCIAIVDLDDFTGLRARSGDEEADESLSLLADTLRCTLRPDDLVCRLDGGRFGVVLANCAGPQATAALERVREALVLSIAADEGPHFTFSAGVVESHRATSIEDLMDQARTATQQARSDGGNRVSVAHD